MSRFFRVMYPITIGSLVFEWAVYRGHPIETSFAFASLVGVGSVAISVWQMRERRE